MSKPKKLILLIPILFAALLGTCFGGIWLINASDLSHRHYPGSKSTVRQQDAIFILSNCLDAASEIETLNELDSIRTDRSIKLRHDSITLDEWKKPMQLEFIERSDRRIAGTVWTTEPSGNLLGHQFEFTRDHTGEWQGLSRWFSAKPGTVPWSDDGVRADWGEIRRPH